MTTREPFFELAEDVPMNDREVVIETSPSPEHEVNVEDYYEDECSPSFSNDRILEKTMVTYQDYRSSPGKTEPLARTFRNNSTNVVEMGRHVIYGVAERTYTNNRLFDKFTKNNNVGEICISSLVSNLMENDFVDSRFAMVGTSMMINSLKSNIKAMNTSLNTKASRRGGLPFENIDIDIKNIDRKEKYMIPHVECFMMADLTYVLSRTPARDNAKLLNKAKSLVKKYFTIACAPRCFIWRYNHRKTGSCHKKTILDLPQIVVETLIDFLMDLTGIGRYETPFEALNENTPFFEKLGEDLNQKREEYERLSHSRDGLLKFFRCLITDCLNEVREMPFCVNTGTLISPLRGRMPSITTICWKEYEKVLREEFELGTNASMFKRMNFEDRIRQIPCFNNAIRPKKLFMHEQ